ncbi:MAG: Chorismate dehydratase [candidate division BRC1 bacterium ADurb.BinA364]|nr:MAG: Chorismate dehydratase [candidate division BRC1 bacterium ADurb.BinA364]
MTDSRRFDFSSVPALRVGVVPYLNVQPLVYGLEQLAPQLALIRATPAELGRMFCAGRIDIGIAPVFASFLASDRGILPAPSIASDSEVLSVILAANEPLERLRVVWRDPNSMTSNALAAVLNARKWGGRIEFADSPPRCRLGPEGLRPGEGRLLIGDPALRWRSRYAHIVDLAREWKDWTGLPFVFAAWVGRIGCDFRGLPSLLEASYRRNAARLPEAAAAYVELPELDMEARVRYLRENIRFEFGAEEKRAIERFHAECAGFGLIPVDSAVRWLDDR